MLENGQTVKVDFVGTLGNGAEFSNSHLVGEPFQFTLGEGTMLAAFEDAVRAMDVGQQAKVRIPMEEAYGPYDEALIERVPVARFPNAGDLPVGRYIVVETPEESLRVKVLGFKDGFVYFDHNHELAGEDLYFTIDLLEAS
ncbi:MAG TPA: FKBP-type peptidyl-prolyl cis-trans isomerase [Candidatus Aphodovivens avistercoris]|nr:FKBP-type peptidyl-prolyl cis-trans isomerase [Candidatus Aphodovivens avistercoris]